MHARLFWDFLKLRVIAFVRSFTLHRLYRRPSGVIAATLLHFSTQSLERTVSHCECNISFVRGCMQYFWTIFWNYAVLPLFTRSHYIDWIGGLAASLQQLYYIFSNKSLERTVSPCECNISFVCGCMQYFWRLFEITRYWRGHSFTLHPLNRRPSGVITATVLNFSSQTLEWTVRPCECNISFVRLHA